MRKRTGRIKKYRKPYIVCKNYTDIFSGNAWNCWLSPKCRYSFFGGISRVDHLPDLHGKLEDGGYHIPVVMPAFH